MKKRLLSFVAVAMISFSLPAFSQADKDSVLKSLPGANLDLYAVLDLFQKSKTIEEFEKNLNLEKTGINNLDLDLDKKVDFIKVVTTKKDDDFTFVLQVAVSKTETQDVAVILVSKDKEKKITMQIVGDKDLYGKDFIVEPKESTTPSKTPNPGYTGENPDTVYVPAKTTTVVVEQAPIVQYVYSPAYVPYVPPYYYGYYPPYYAAFTVMAVGMYWGAHAHYHSHGYGYHGNTTVIHNTNNFNNYNNNRNTSGTVDRNRQSGNYNRGNNAATTRPSTGAGGGNRPSQGAGGGARPSTQPSGGAGGGARPSTQPSGGRGSEVGGGARPSNQPSNSFSGSSSRPTTQPSNNRSSGGSNYNNNSSRSRGSGGYSGGGGGSRSSGGGGSRGGGGGGRGGGGRR